MFWTEEIKHRCFQNNDSFVTNYCSPQTIVQMREPSGNRIETVREVASFFAEAFPDVAHSTPRWNRLEGESIPLIKFGYPSLLADGRIRLSSFAGLCLANDQVRIWVSQEVQEHMPQEYQWAIFRNARNYCSNYTVNDLISDERFVAALTNFLDTLNGPGEEVRLETLINWGEEMSSNKLVCSCTPLMIHLRNRLRYW